MRQLAVNIQIVHMDWNIDKRRKLNIELMDFAFPCLFFCVHGRAFRMRCMELFAAMRPRLWSVGANKLFKSHTALSHYDKRALEFIDSVHSLAAETPVGAAAALTVLLEYQVAELGRRRMEHFISAVYWEDWLSTGAVKDFGPRQPPFYQFTLQLIVTNLSRDVCCRTICVGSDSPNFHASGIFGLITHS